MRSSLHRTRGRFAAAIMFFVIHLNKKWRGSLMTISQSPYAGSPYTGSCGLLWFLPAHSVSCSPTSDNVTVCSHITCHQGRALPQREMKSEKSDSVYEEPETDHIYEGLAIETCGGGLYEELSIYAQAEGAEAPWE
uniref:Uncharacterized protein n=1 Tax=Seriola dumerili TaxID=41447 RepID=A0A3B4UDQ9_SERDU